MDPSRWPGKQTDQWWDEGREKGKSREYDLISRSGRHRFVGVMLSLRFRLSAEGDWFSLSSSQNPLRAETEKHSINFKTNPWGEIGHWPPFVRAAAGENPSKKRLLNYFTACSPLRSIGNTRDDSPPGSNVSVLSFKRSCRSSIICSREVSTLLFTKLRRLDQRKYYTLVLSRIIALLSWYNLCISFKCQIFRAKYIYVCPKKLVMDLHAFTNAYSNCILIWT